MTILKPGLEQRQSQTLSMTPQLRQAIELLELSNLDLATYLQQALLENPLLEAENQAPEESASLSPEEDTPVYDHDNLWSSGSAAPSQKIFSTEAPDPFINISSPEKSLRDIVCEQINIRLDDTTERLIAHHLVSYLEPTGYLSPDYTKTIDELGCEKQDLETVIQKLQAFEPFGVFARTLQECLKPQLKEKGKLTRQMEKVLDHLEDFSNGRVSQVLKKCGLTQEQFAACMITIQEQNPRPGLVYDQDSFQTLIPDVRLNKTHEGWNVALNEDSLPKVLVNQPYATNMKNGKLDSKTKKYLKTCLQKANFITKALDQRAKTLLKVSNEILKQQEHFFLNGIRYLKPMVLKDVAEEIEMHESTISRVTNNKYISTPRGTFELKYFFTSGLKSNKGKADMSSQMVKHRIKELIDEEDRMHPLSDDELVTILNDEGIDVARRTVAKYREAENLASSFQRRKRYRIEGVA